MRFRGLQRRRALALPAVGGLAALLLATAAGPASARTVGEQTQRTVISSSEAAFQANTNLLYAYYPASNKHINSHLGMRPHSSPSISDAEVAFVANTGVLWLWHPGGNGRRDSHLIVHAGSPAIAASADEYGVAFQGADRNLWIYYYVPGKGWAHYDTHLSMMPGTSPSLTGRPGGGWEVAYEGLDRRLYLYSYNAGQPGHLIRTGKFMDPASSPAITLLLDGQYQVAYQYYTHRLAVYTTKSGNFLTGLGMDPGTSPSIAGDSEVAFQDNTNHLWLYHPANNTNHDTRLGMTPGTSPSIVFLPSGYQIAFQADTGILWIDNLKARPFGSGLGMWIDSSPAVSS